MIKILSAAFLTPLFIKRATNFAKDAMFSAFKKGAFVVS